MTRRVVSSLDPGLSATIIERRPLVYGSGGSDAIDRPAHVRAASGVVRLGRRWAVVQDDALFLAFVTDAGSVGGHTLPSMDGVRQFDDVRGNKHEKLDLEAIAEWPTPSGSVVLLLGSGSTSARERWVVLGGSGMRVLGLSPLYAALRSMLPGAELNLEGAWRTAGGDLRLLQRGNGVGGRSSVFEVRGSYVDRSLEGGPDADVPIAHVLDLDVGDVGGVSLTPTDATSRGAVWLFSAAAEDSPDAVRDGRVVGSAVGWCDDHHAGHTLLTDNSGATAIDKIEGIAPSDAPNEVVVVTDPDDPDQPAELLVVRLGGPWPRSGPIR